MKNSLILMMAAIMLTISCGKSSQNGIRQKELAVSDSLYTWEYIRQSMMEQPEYALALIDTAKMRGLTDENHANWMRSCIYYSSPKVEDIDKARNLCQQVLDNKKPEADSLLRLRVISQLVDICKVDPDTYQDAVRYAISGAEMAHQTGNLLQEADFYFNAGEVMERLQLGSGMAYMNRSLDIYREACRDSIRPLPKLSSYLGGMSRILTGEENYSAAIPLLQERLQVISRVEKEIATAPAGWADQQRAYTYSILATCQYSVGDKEGARRSAEAFEQTKAAQLPGNQSDILNYYAAVGDASRMQQIYNRLESDYREAEDTISSGYARLLFNYAIGLDNIGRSHEAYQTLYRYVVIDDSLKQRDRQDETLKYAQQMRTQEKDLQIAEQQATLSQQRWIGTLVAMGLLILFFIIYTEYRRRAANRLGEAHVQLQSAYDQLEETTAAKERIESELRIARNIQMSMVPGMFPECDGLDMYAEMTPAKEVGGDLYGYVMQGDRLYFCVGDVSGKGVPASLFMAQSARLFRTLAAEGMMPADIAFRMNNEMAEGNDNNMFVTMFIGMLHLDTGRLDYCNCGHNAPILDGQFLKMAYVNQPLGLWEDDPFEGETIDDIRGRQLLIYTDGLNEAENGQEELLGNARLLELMANTVNLSSREVIDMLKEAVEQHRNGAEPNDDLTLMCITFQI